MNPGDLIRVKKLEYMDAAGYLLHVLSDDGKGTVGVVILSGPHFGKEHVVNVREDAREFEVISG